MPLNINDDQLEELSSPDKPRPILRGVSTEPKSNKKVLLLVFGLVVLGAAVLLVYLFSTMKPGTETAQQPAEAKPAEPIAAAGQQPAESVPPAAQAVTAPPAELPTLHGVYTIFIASYAERPPAEEEVGRWKEAGYQAFVIEVMGHFRVAVGDYAAFSEARAGAASLSDAFENGYWIGKR